MLKSSFLFKQTKTTLVLCKMAKSKYDYVKSFEVDKKLIPNCWILVRLDGHAFHKFAEKHGFNKPNDLRALNLMNRAAITVMQHFKDILLGFGESDEYSFVFRKDSVIYNRREAKIMTYINSLFSSSYVLYWRDYFPNLKMLYPPAFDARVVLYPADKNLQDYFRWRQADTHINNLYNTTFWSLVKKAGLTPNQAEERLKGTLASEKNEILFSQFNINYNNEPNMYRKGTILVRKKIKNPEDGKLNLVILPLHEDLIQEQFWEKNSEILNIQGTQIYDWPPDKELPQLVKLQIHKHKHSGDDL